LLWRIHQLESRSGMISVWTKTKKKEITPTRKSLKVLRIQSTIKSVKNQKQVTGKKSKSTKRIDGGVQQKSWERAAAVSDDE